MRDVGPERETAIFDALAGAGEYRLLESVARQFFPAELLLQLPSHILKACLDTMPLEKRADLIYSRDDRAQREALLSAYGKQGSRVREMLDLELDRVKSDELRRKRVERNRGPLWKEFAEICRGVIRSDGQAAEMAQIAVNAWLFDKSAGEVGGQDASAA